MNRSFEYGGRRGLLAVSVLLVCALALSTPARQQQPPQKPSPTPRATPPVVTQQPSDESDEVLRVETELVQTAVTVLDRQGRFVEGLRREQFEMTVDGKPQPVTFFEQVMATGVRRQLAAAPGKADTTAAAGPSSPPATERGRTVFLFVDDVHLTQYSHGLVRQTLRRYVDTRMGQNDQTALVTTTGQLGFLEQLTDDKQVLRAAAERINLRAQVSSLTGRPHITTYQAIAIDERNDSRILEFLVDETMRTTPTLPRGQAEQLVRHRARIIALDAAGKTRATLSALESVLRTSARLPGRKVVILLSDGFILQTQNTNEAEQLRRITDAAARAEAVVHAVDARGLATDPYFEAARDVPPDPTGRGLAASHSTAEMRAQQDPLRTIADETGGRAVVNTNDLPGGIERAVEESSRYYLLAWRPEREENRRGQFRRIEVAVAGRPDLSVRLHRGYIEPDAKPDAKRDKPARPATPQEALRAELSAAFPARQLPVALAVSFVDLPDAGAVVTASASVPSYPLAFKPAGGKQAAAFELACFVFDQQGKPAASAQERITVSTADEAESGIPQRDIAYNFRFDKLPPGLYQVRVAARDEGSGRIGGAARWIEIPDLKKRRLALSSLLVGRLPAGARAAFDQLEFAASHRFARASRLGFYAYIYNASRGEGGRAAPDLTARVRVLHNDRALIDSGERKVSTEGADDPARLPYGADFDLSTLPPGRYLLEVAVTDGRAKQTAKQTARFEIR
jgi:VWFA-related protein